MHNCWWSELFFWTKLDILSLNIMAVIYEFQKDHNLPVADYDRPTAQQCVGKACHRDPLLSDGDSPNEGLKVTPFKAFLHAYQEAIWRFRYRRPPDDLGLDVHVCPTL